MGNVVAFNAPEMRKGRPKPDRPCEITIFPGVRYEYHGTVPKPVARPPDRAATLRVEIPELESV